MTAAKSFNCTLQSFAFDGRTVVVAGGLGLIGRSIAAGLAGCRASVVIADVDALAWDAARGEFESAGLSVSFEAMDVTDTMALPERIAELDTIYNPAGWINAAYPRTDGWGEGVEAVSPEHWSRDVEMQMNSACILASEAAKRLAAASLISPQFMVWCRLISRFTKASI